eukprot:1159828-Pelagomonas_calceolata.AAC.6
MGPNEARILDTGCTVHIGVPHYMCVLSLPSTSENAFFWLFSFAKHCWQWRLGTLSSSLIRMRTKAGITQMPAFTIMHQWWLDADASIRYHASMVA